MRRACRDIDGIVGLDVVYLVADANAGAATQHILLVLDRVGMKGHATARAHDEAAHGEVRRAVVLANENLGLRRGAGCDFVQFEFRHCLHDSLAGLSHRPIPHSVGPIAEPRPVPA